MVARGDASDGVVMKNFNSAAEDRYVGEGECRIITGLSRTTRWRLERLGAFPSRRHLSENRVGWLLSELIAWRDARRAKAQVAA